MTYSSFGQLAEAINNVRARLEAEWPRMVSGYALDMVALVEERITTTGTDVNGAKLKAYTEQYKEFKQNPGRYKRGKELGIGSSRYTGKTDYSLTGEMWRDISVRRVSEAGGKVSVTVAPSLPVNQDKLDSLSRRDGDPLRVSEEEQAISLENLNQQFLEILSPIL